MTKMDAFKGDKAVFLPKRTFKDTLTIGSGNERIDLYYFGAGHTNGDAMVYFPALRVLQTGDLFARKDAPRIDRANGAAALPTRRRCRKPLPRSRTSISSSRATAR